MRHIAWWVAGIAAAAGLAAGAWMSRPAPVLPMSAPPTHADYQLSQLDQLEAVQIREFVRM